MADRSPTVYQEHLYWSDLVPRALGIGVAIPNPNNLAKVSFLSVYVTGLFYLSIWRHVIDDTIKTSQ